MNLKSSIIRVFSANFLSMLSGVIIGFVVPAILSVESYSFVRNYAFYVSYIGILHFGFIDGMYIKYGGKERENINKAEFKAEHKMFMLLQVVVTLIFILFSVLIKDITLFFMGLSIIPINTLEFHKLFYQATGQFKDYAKASYIYTAIYLGLNILLALVFRSDNYIYYCLSNIIANGTVYILLEFKFYKDTKGIKAQYNSKLWNNIKIGFFVLLGNLSVILFYAIDRWFIKFFFNIEIFAYYSFAISMLNIINLLVGAISITFYNYLSKGEDREKLRVLKNYFLIIGGLSSFGYFILAAIVTIFLKKYIPALNIIAISFSAYPYMIVINALYVNLYKARKGERKYVKVVFFMVIVSAIYNTIAISLWKKPESIAIATTISFITWYIYSMRDFRYLKSTYKEVMYLSILIVSFLVFSHGFNWWIGGSCYIIIFIITSSIFFRNEVSNILNIILSKVKH